MVTDSALVRAPCRSNCSITEGLGRLIYGQQFNCPRWLCVVTSSLLVLSFKFFDINFKKILDICILFFYKKILLLFFIISSSTTGAFLILEVNSSAAPLNKPLMLVLQMATAWSLSCIQPLHSGTAVQALLKKHDEK